MPEHVLLEVLELASEEFSSFPRSITDNDDAAFVVGSAEVGVLIVNERQRPEAMLRIFICEISLTGRGAAILRNNTD